MSPVAWASPMVFTTPLAAFKVMSPPKMAQLWVRGIPVYHPDDVCDSDAASLAHGRADREIRIWNQHVPAHELSPFDDRDELIAELLAACKVAFDQTCSVGRPKDWEQLRAAIAKATGSVA